MSDINEEIRKVAEEKAMIILDPVRHKSYVAGFIAGATAYATRVQQLEDALRKVESKMGLNSDLTKKPIEILDEIYLIVVEALSLNTENK